MTMIGVHVGGLPGQEAISVSLYIIKLFVKSKRNSRWCCSYLIRIGDTFSNHNRRWDEWFPWSKTKATKNRQPKTEAARDRDCKRQKPKK